MTGAFAGSSMKPLESWRTRVKTPDAALAGCSVKNAKVTAPLLCSIAALERIVYGAA
jgi:hypothetical protein